VNIGIIVFSHTGHTLKVTRKLKERLTADGHDVTLEELEPVEPLNLSATTAPLKRIPAIDEYEALVLGSPVNGAQMSAPMKSYLDQTPSLQGKQVALLLTHFFPSQWGANQTIAQMTEACESKGATVIGSGDVRWMSLRRRRQIAQAVDSVASCLAS